MSKDPDNPNNVQPGDSVYQITDPNQIMYYEKYDLLIKAAWCIWKDKKGKMQGYGFKLETLKKVDNS